MKTIILLLFITSMAFGQNAVSVSFAPAELGLGIKYEKLFKESGVYTSFLHGNYHADPVYIKNHFRYSTGITIRNFTAGVVYHQFGEVIGEFPPNTLNPVSCELGLRRVTKWLVAGIRCDPIKKEGIMDLGFKF